MRLTPLLATLAIVEYTLARNVASMWAQCGGKGWKGATECQEPATCYSQNPFYYQCTTFKGTTTAATTKSHQVTASPTGEVAMWGQCGGQNWKGPTKCVEGATCYSQNPYYYQCTTVKSALPTDEAAMWGQCGGKNWKGPTKCVKGATCYSQNPFYYQCTTFKSTSTTSKAPPAITSHPAPTGTVGMWGQCGGENWKGPTKCVEGATCYSQNPYYYQCTTFAGVSSPPFHNSSTNSVETTLHGTKTAHTSLVGMYSQCGGKNWNGPTKCVEDATCVSQNPFYHQCTTKTENTNHKTTDHWIYSPK